MQHLQICKMWLVTLKGFVTLSASLPRQSALYCTASPCASCESRTLAAGSMETDHWLMHGMARERCLLAHLEADVLSSEIVRENGYGGGVVGSELLPVGAAVARPVVPLHHRHVAPCSLERDVRLRRRHHHLLSARTHISRQKRKLCTRMHEHEHELTGYSLHVGPCVDLHDDAHGVVLRHGVDGLLDGEEVAAAARVHHDPPHAHRLPVLVVPARRASHGAGAAWHASGGRRLVASVATANAITTTTRSRTISIGLRVYPPRVSITRKRDNVFARTCVFVTQTFASSPLYISLFTCTRNMW